MKKIPFNNIKINEIKISINKKGTVVVYFEKHFQFP